MTEWFRRLADIPSVDYESDPRVKRSTLPGHDIVPTLDAYTLGEEPREILWWATAGGQTTRSPAAAHADLITSGQQDHSPRELVQRLHEVLELPGFAKDYHFAIQSCAEALWKQRRRDPSLLVDAERLWWLDIRLVEARTETITFERDGTKVYAGVSAFHHLADLYSHEGFIHEALEVAERGTRLNQAMPVEKLRERLVVLEAEES